MSLTNNHNIPLPLAVFLAHDEYPEHKENTISVTTLIKPIKEIVLSMRMKSEGIAAPTEDVSGLLASALGTAAHNRLEDAWTSPQLKMTLSRLGYPNSIIDQILVNPSPEEAGEGIDVYTEFRTHKRVMGWDISGEFDFLADGRLYDLKTTGVYTWVNQTNFEKYQLQLSLYRWLNPEKVYDDMGSILFNFTDWSGMDARIKQNYPPMRMMEQLIPLLSVEEMDEFVRDRLKLIDRLRTAEQHEIPACTDKDLWVGPPKFKYYKDPDNAKRATKVCDTMQEALVAKAKAGGMGVILEVKEKVRACKYCKARPICDQANRYLNSGELEL